MRRFILPFLFPFLIFGQISNPSVQVTPPLTGTGATSNPLSCPTCGSGTTPGYLPSGLLSGGGVLWTGLLNFTVSSALYVISGTQYSSAMTNITLAAADPSNPRIDVIALDTTSAVVVLTGTPAASPAAPVVDPATQLALTFVTVGAGATTPTNIATTLIYDENVGAAAEWNTSSSGAGWSLGSTNNPYHLTKDIEATNVGTSASVTLQKGAGTVDLSTFNVLGFYLRSKAEWGSKRSLTIYWANGGTQVGNAVTLREGSFGFVSSSTTSYQQMAIVPIGLFQTGSQVVNQLVIKVGGTGGSLGFYIDWIQIQSGLTQLAPASGMTFRNIWQSSAAYNINDVVTCTGLSTCSGTWIALVANTSVAPTEGTTWTALGTGAASVLISTSGPVTDPGGATVYQFNNAAGALTFNAPAGVAGYQRCYRNAATRTGAITIQMAASNTVDIFGANGSAAGTLASAGALGDSVCIVSDTTNHWYAYISSGTWTASGASGGATFNPEIRVAQTVIGSPAASITFSTLPTGYTNLRIMFMGRTAKAGVTDDLYVRFNNDSGGNYTRQAIGAGNTTVSASKDVASTQYLACSMSGDTVTANYAGACTVWIYSYAGTTFFKTMQSKFGWYDNTNPQSYSTWATWLNTAAITSIQLTNASSSNFKTGTTATLYAEY